MAGRIDFELIRARARWRAAEEQLYPLALSDVTGYENAVRRVGVVLGELRLRCGDLDELLRAENDPAVLDVAGRAGCALDGPVVVAAACALRSAELAAGRDVGIDNRSA